jgi:uncharacterized protein DUF5659
MQPSREIPEAFETQDLNLASFIRCRGFTVGDIRREYDKIIFLFQDSTELRRAIVDYINDGAIAVQSFCATQRNFKSLMRGTGDGKHSTNLKSP